MDEELGTQDGFAKSPYIREPRRLVARTIVTEAHVGTDQRRAAGADRDAAWSATPYGTAHPFADSVGIGHYAIDLHPSCAGRNNVYVPCAPFRVPLGSLIPVRVRNLIANPRNGAIYSWTNNLASRAVALANAPVQTTYTLVSPTRQVFALGCNQEASPFAFDPLVIRHSSVGNNTEWNTAASTSAREYRLPGGGRIVCGAVMGENLLIWTTGGLFVGTFVGSIIQPWRFDQVGEECGIIGPNAFTVVGQQAFWVGPNLQFYAYTLGSQPVLVPCPIQDDFADNMAPAQTDKITVGSTAFFNEIRIDYPDARDGVECSRYLAAHIPTLLNAPESAWYRGNMARTAYSDAPPSPNSYPIAADPQGNLYWHEKGQSANGAPLSWFIETADNYLDPALTMQLRTLWPDFKDQVGAVEVAAVTRFYPQASETSTSGQTMAPGQSKSDLRATGRLAKLRFSGLASPSFVRLGNPTIDVTPAGQR